MTVEDLKNELHGREFPDQVQINPDQIVVDVEKFLRVQFLACDNWKKDIEKCPSYVRLVSFIIDDQKYLPIVFPIQTHVLDLF